MLRRCVPAAWPVVVFVSSTWDRYECDSPGRPTQQGERIYKYNIGPAEPGRPPAELVRYWQNKNAPPLRCSRSHWSEEIRKVIFFFPPSAANAPVYCFFIGVKQKRIKSPRGFRGCTPDLSRGTCLTAGWALCVGEVRCLPLPPELGPLSGLISSFELGWRKPRRRRMDLPFKTPPVTSQLHQRDVGRFPRLLSAGLIERRRCISLVC